MSKKSRRLIIVAMVVALLAVSLGSFNAPAPKAEAQDTVTITWWHINTAEDQAANWQAIADQFMAEHDNVEIEITILENEAFKERLAVVMQAGDPPDLFQSWGGGVLWSYADAGLVRDFSDEFAGDWEDSFAVPAAVNLYRFDGGVYGVPWTWGAVGFFYNKALFAEAGLDPDSPPATWDEFLAAVQALKDAGITPISLGEQDKWPGHFWWVYLAIRSGGEDAFLSAYNRDGAFTDDPFVEAGEHLQDLIDLDPFPDGFLQLTYNDQAALVGNGEAAMELMGQWAPDVESDQSESGEGIGEDLGWFPFPELEGGYEGVLGGGDGFAVGANAPDETIEFLKLVTTVENQLAMAEQGWVVPVVSGTESAIEGNAVLEAIVDARNNAGYFQLYYDQFLPPAVGSAVVDSVQALFVGDISPEGVTEWIEDEASFELD
jgi:raffinose/stachyose/melibiose transport system substrate-binding protein